MASRKHCSARPTPSRLSVAPSPGPATARHPAPAADELPPYKKPSHPLDRRAEDQLRALNGRSVTYLKEKNEQAGENITHAAELINDTLRERHEEMEKRRKRWERGIHKEDQEEEEEILKRFEKKVEDATKQLEESMRAVIDGGEAAQRIQQSLVWLREHAPGALEREYQTQMTQRESQRQTQQQSQSQRQRQSSPDHESDEDIAENEQPEGPTPGPTPLDGSRPVLSGLSEMFADRQAKKKDEYTAISLSGRYTTNNAYVNFKRMVHDAHFGDDGPPLPHPDTWFTETGAPAPGTQRGAINDDDDLVIDSERISTRCPLTFQQFREPLTSTKCKHTFEKNAILEMIGTSNLRVGGSGRNGTRAVKCPLPGCEEMLTASNLVYDPILVRKIKRIQAQAAREAEASDEDDNDEDFQHQRSQTVRRGNVKVEPLPSRTPRQGTVVEDLGSPSEPDDDDE